MHVRYGRYGAHDTGLTDGGRTTSEEQMTSHPTPQPDQTDIAQRIEAAEDELRHADAIRLTRIDRSGLLLQNERLRSALADLVQLNRELLRHLRDLREHPRCRGDQR